MIKYIIFIVLLIPFFFEYFAVFWIWAGDGTYNLFVYPPLLLLGYGLHYRYIRKAQGRKRNYLIASAIFITPLVAAIILFTIAWILGVDSHIE